MRLHLPDCAPWYALVGRAQIHTGILLDAPLEGYLVTLMQRVRHLRDPEAHPDPMHRLQAMAEQYLLTATLIRKESTRAEDAMLLARECYRQLARLEEEGRFVPVLEGLEALAAVLEAVRELSDEARSETAERERPFPRPEGGEVPRRRPCSPAASLPAGSLSH